jgi:hypothetical protein
MKGGSGERVSFLKARRLSQFSGGRDCLLGFIILRYIMEIGAIL